MATFDEMRRLTSTLAKEVSDLTGVKISLVVNVIQYSRQLIDPVNPDVIDELVFIAQMGHRFGITSLFHIKLMFDAVRIKDTKLIRLEEYVKVICIFYSQKLDVKIDFVFSVYDFYHDKHISQKEMMALLKTSIVSSGEDDPEESLKELIDMVMLEFDIDRDGLISLEEFRCLVHKNKLYMQLLGQVLPHKTIINKFMDSLKNKTPLAVKNLFLYERTDCLFVPRRMRPMDALYPVILDLP